MSGSIAKELDIQGADLVGDLFDDAFFEAIKLLWFAWSEEDHGYFQTTYEIQNADGEALKLNVEQVDYNSSEGDNGYGEHVILVSITNDEVNATSDTTEVADGCFLVQMIVFDRMGYNSEEMEEPTVSHHLEKVVERRLFMDFFSSEPIRFVSKVRA
ncbi:MAG: hypothetical protein U5S82_13450 [Gammaproteobacteria bacterium]|nr:hypothetical protein [Gammaproteobacteria bacterium]